MTSAKHCIIASLMVLGTVLGWIQYGERIPKLKIENITPQQKVAGTHIEGEEIAVVARVIDGDTIELADGRKVRYIGIDTPETKHPKKKVQCFGKQAFLKNKELVEAQEIQMQRDVSETDRYGRLLRFVYVGEVFVNELLVREGYAYAATFPPDVKYQDIFLDAQRDAKENKRGLWGECGM